MLIGGLPLLFLGLEVVMAFLADNSPTGANTAAPGVGAVRRIFAVIAGVFFLGLLTCLVIGRQQ